MKKVAVFGNAGAGKSTLARRLAAITRLPLYPLDLIQYKPGGGKVADEEYVAAHAALLRRDQWIIDGFGTLATAWERFAAADTLIYIDLPLATHYWWVTKRLIEGLFVNPEGWPENSPIWSSTLDSYKVVGRCHRHLTPRYRELVAELAATKRVHHLRVARRDGGTARCRRAGICSSVTALFAKRRQKMTAPRDPVSPDRAAWSRQAAFAVTAGFVKALASWPEA